MKNLLSFSLIFFLLFIFTSCRKDHDLSMSDRSFDTSLPAGQLVFSHYPVDPNIVTFILALGHLNPPGHTRPSDHMYFVNVPAGTVLEAPASGKVLDTFTFDEGNGQHDNRITIGVTNTASYYFMHVVLDAGIKIGDEIKVGQRLGVLRGGFDIGVMVKTIEQPFLDPALYGLSSLHCDSPIKHFPVDMQAALYARVQRLGVDKDGRICYDKAGTLSGNWIAEKAPRDPNKTDHFDSYFVSFVYGNQDPSKMVISIGNDSFFTSLNGQPDFQREKVFYVQKGAPKFEDVTQASGKVTYKLYGTGEFDIPLNQRVGLLIAQLLTNEKIKIEFFDDTIGDHRDFTGNAKIYVR